MFRGRGGHHQGRRDFRGGHHNNSPVNRGPPPQHKPNESSKPQSPKHPPPKQITPAKSPPGKITPVVNKDVAPKTPNKPEEQNGARPRSRSPIKRKDKDEVTITNVVENSEGPSNIFTKVVEKVVEKKYTGRPGEKKFNGRCRLFVANLHNTITEEELRAEFNEYGETGEVYVNKEKGFGFIRLDYRHNAEMAKLSLDKKIIKNRPISVRYATHASAIELHGLDNYASNEFLLRAMSSFGAVERCIVVCDDRGRSKGYAIVEFEWKKAAAKVLDRFKDEMFVLGRLPKPVFAKPFVMNDEEEGVTEESLERLEGIEQERAHEPRFISPNSFEYTWAKRWRDLFIEEQDKKAKLEQEMTDARCKLEFEMEAALRQSEAARIREDLARRQEELRMLSEDMMRRQEADMQILERSRQREMAARSGNPEPPPENEQELYQNEMQLSRENAARHHDFMQLRQRAENAMQNDLFSRTGGVQQGGGFGQMRQGGGGQDMMGGGGGFGGQWGATQQGGFQGGHAHGGRGGHSGGRGDFRGGIQQRGGPIRDSRDLPPRDGDVGEKDKPTDHKGAELVTEVVEAEGSKRPGGPRH